MEIKTKADAIAFFATPDACVPCQMVGAYYGGSGANCYDTLAAMSVYANADLAERIERNKAKTDAKPAPVAPLTACTDCGGAGLMYGEPTCPRCVGSGYEPTYYTDAAKPKGSDVVPDATSPYPCGRFEMHEAGACECHGHHP